ncbi:hypothetical protein ACIBG8_54340 [Nonomuraea sp. NPDC050556]|uniref:hypothetical protein n=1 Tax=Nonomuraea sp. NPDC050556 TaxID=3364369 RepID=UPI0037928DD7
MTTPNQILLGTDRELWERQSGESERQYSRFAMYRDLGRARTVKQCAELVNLAHGTAHNAAHRFRWRERAEAWDRQQDKIFLAQLAAKRRELMDTEAKIANGVLRHVIGRLSRLTSQDVDEMDLWQVARSGDTALKWLRDAYGVAGGTTLAAAVVDDVAAAQPNTDASVGEVDEMLELARLHEENAAFLRRLAVPEA